MSRPGLPYRYSSLPDSSVRLLKLIPHWDEQAPIQCSLFNCPVLVSGGTSHPFEALSYVWGSPDRTHFVYIDNCYLPITASLHAALSRLRDSFIDRILWADAICINQHDLGERAQQIQCMATIYAKASRVLVWLGEEASDSSLALETIHRAADKRYRLGEEDDAEHEEGDAVGCRNACLLALTERPWFRRIWVRKLLR
jgi:hypothetical protein